MDSSKEYFAFISYKREDERWAEWLQHKLEHYRLPSNLNGRTDLPKEIRPIFKDTTDLNPGNLPRQIHEALEQSKHLIVICSPRSARSEWVNKEVETFIGMGRADRIIPFIIEGTAFAKSPGDECFPPALKALPEEQEILGANINETGRDAAAVKVVAQMFQLKFDTLWQRHERYRRKRRRAVTTGLLCLLISVCGVAYWMWQKNAELERQNEIIFRAKLEQDIALSKNHLYRNNPEMAIVALEEVRRNLPALDSLTRARYDELLLAINDSLSVRPIHLLTQDAPAPSDSAIGMGELIASNPMFRYSKEDEDGHKGLYITRHEKGGVVQDTISDWYPNHIHIAVNRERTYAAIFKEGDPKFDCIEGPDMKESPKKSGIRIYPLDGGALKNFINCWGYFPYLVYPIALSSDADKLIYREVWRDNDWIWLADFRKGTRTSVRGWVDNEITYSASNHADGAFSPDDEYYYLHYSKDNKIAVYDTRDTRPIYTFGYEQCDTVYWDEASDLRVSSRGYTYVWSVRRGNLTKIFHAGPSLIAAVALSNDCQMAAAACADGTVSVWKLSTGECLWNGKVIDSPSDIAFTRDGRSLWVISGFNKLRGVDLVDKRTFMVVSKEPEKEHIPYHPYGGYLHFTDDGRHCISYFDYGSQYALYDVQERRQLEVADEVPQFPLPEETYRDPDLTDKESAEPITKKLSADSTTVIEGYPNGTLKVRSTLFSTGHTGLADQTLR